MLKKKTKANGQEKTLKDNDFKDQDQKTTFNVHIRKNLKGLVKILKAKTKRFEKLNAKACKDQCKTLKD